MSKAGPQLVEAVRSEDVSLVRDILSRGDRRVLGQRDRHGRTALHCAVLTSQAGLVDSLLEAGADLFARDGDGYTPLELAAFVADDGIVNKLVRAGADGEAQALAAREERRPGAESAEALALKERLMRYDNSEEGSKVLDDQADYYSSTAWLSEEEQRALAEREARRQERMSTQRRNVRVTIDITGRKVVEVEEDPLDDLAPAAGAFPAPAPRRAPAPQGADRAGARAGAGAGAAAAGSRGAGSTGGTGEYENRTLSGMAQEVYDLLRA